MMPAEWLKLNDRFGIRLQRLRLIEAVSNHRDHRVGLPKLAARARS